MVLAGGLSTALPGVRLCGAYQYTDYVLIFSTVIRALLRFSFTPVACRWAIKSLAFCFC